MKRSGVLIALFVVFLMVTGVCAEEKRLSDEAELSFVDTGGNSEVTTLSAKNLLGYKFTEKLEGAWKFRAMYGKSNGDKDLENYFNELRLDYIITERLYASAIAGWLQDKFAGIDSRFNLGPGVGYKFFTGPKHFLLGEAGINYVYEDYIDGTEEDYIEGRTFAQYEYPFTEKNKFSQSLEFLFAFDDIDNFNINSETAFIFALNDYLSLKASYEIKYDNQPVPSTLKETDTILAISLIVNF